MSNSSDKPISVGDLVEIIKPMRCRCNGSLGRLFVVQEMAAQSLPGRHYKRDGGCDRFTYPPGTVVAVWDDHGNEMTTEISRLKRIPPPEELGIVDEREELHA